MQPAAVWVRCEIAIIYTTSWYWSAKWEVGSLHPL